MTPLSKDKLNLLFLSIIIISGILLYLPSTSISFLNDEIAFIKRNQVSSLTELANLFDKKDYDGDYYRPFVNFTSGLITIAGGYNPVFYRIFNILLHTANGILVYFFILSLMQGKDKKDIISLFGALFFISFPLNDYSVIWHTDLFDRLMTSFYLLSLIFFIRKKTWGITSLIFFLLALLSKEMAFSLPFAVFLFSWFLNDNNRFIKAIKDSIPYIFILLILI
ncbi:MAG: hypothetical protein EHM47_18250, partial [Ignavibacteriales bacterium]